MQFNNIQSNNTHNASFAPNTAAANQPQQGAQPQARVLPPLADAADLANNPAARNLQAYNPISIPQGSLDPLAPDNWNLPEYQPIQPGAPYMEKLADEAMNTKKLNIYLKNARDNEELEDFSDAEEAYEKALKYTENAEHYKLYAGCLREIYLTLSRIPLTPAKDEAKERTYKEKAAKAFYYLGELYVKQSAWKEAQAAYKASCELALYEAPLKALGDVARQLGDAAEMSKALEQLADFYAGKGDIASAIKMLEEAVQVEKSSNLLEKLAALHGQAGGEDSQSKVNETRIHQFELQISQDPKNIGLYRKYAWFLKDIGRKSEARTVKERMDRLLQQKLVKQKTKIGGLKQIIDSHNGKLEAQGKQLEFLERQVVHLTFSHWPDMKDIGLLPLLKKNPDIQSMNLEGCQGLTDAVLRILPERFENLKKLNLSRCKGMTEAGLEFIVENATKLKRLTLDYCPGTTIRVLHKLNAKGIAFSIEGVVFEHISLDLSKYKATLTDADLLQKLQENPEITILGLSGCSKITDAGLAPLKNFQWLTDLDLSGCPKITDTGLQYLAGLTQLTHLDLSGCSKLTSKGLDQLSGLTQLKSLNLYDCSKITCVSLVQLERPSLFSVLFSTSHENFIDVGLGQLAGFTQLTSLNLGSCNQLSDAGLRYLAGLTQLRELNLSRCKRLSDGGFQYLRGFTQLTSLNLGSCNQLSDAGLKYLASLTQLRELNLSECNRLNGEGLRYLAGLTQLRELNLSECNRLSNAVSHKQINTEHQEQFKRQMEQFKREMEQFKRRIEQLKKQIPGLRVQY